MIDATSFDTNLDSRMMGESIRAQQRAHERDPDWATLEQVAAGDVNAFARLVDRHQQRLHHLCRRMLHDPEAARDAVQEVFLKAFRKASSYRPGGRVYTWLYRIAVNHCLNRLRRRRLVRFLSLTPAAGAADPTPELDPADSAPDPDRRLADRERWRRTRSMIEKLPPGQRAVLVLIKMEGLSYRQTARTLGITEGAVESRLFRAMRTLEAARTADEGTAIDGRGGR